MRQMATPQTAHRRAVADVAQDTLDRGPFSMSHSILLIRLRGPSFSGLRLGAKICS